MKKLLFVFLLQFCLVFQLFAAQQSQSEFTDWNIRGLYTCTLPTGVSLHKPIGNGAFGRVYEVRVNAHLYACKQSCNNFNDEDTILQSMRNANESNILKHLNHPNIVECFGSCTRNFSNMWEHQLYLKRMDTDLHKIIYSRNILTEDHHRFFMLQILRGLHYIHSAKIVHADLKPGNVLLMQDCVAKIADFGLATLAGGKTGTYITTRWYRAPELLLYEIAKDIILAKRPYRYKNVQVMNPVQAIDFLKHSPISPAIDIWSAGAIFAELLKRSPLFAGDNYIQNHRLIIDFTSISYNQLQQRFPKASPFALDLLRKMLTADPEKRLTAAQALAHPYFEGMGTLSAADEYDGVPAADFILLNEVDPKIIFPKEPLGLLLQNLRTNKRQRFPKNHSDESLNPEEPASVLKNAVSTEKQETQAPKPEFKSEN